MSNLRGQLIEVNPDSRKHNILDLEQRAATEGLPIPTLEWLDPNCINIALIERTCSPYPSSTDSVYYPGRICVGRLKHTEQNTGHGKGTAPENRDVFVWAYLRKSNTADGSISVTDFKEISSGLSKRMVPVYMETPEFLSVRFESWTNLVVGAKTTRGKWHPWGCRIGLPTRIALLLAGYFDGRATPWNTDRGASAKTFAPTLKAVEANIRRRMTLLDKRRTIDDDRLIPCKRSLSPNNAVAHAMSPQNAHVKNNTTSIPMHKQISLLGFYQQTQNEHAVLVRDHDELKEKYNHVREDWTNLSLEHEVAEKRVRILEQDLSNYCTLQGTMESLTREIETLKHERALQGTKFEELKQANQTQERMISSQQTAAEKKEKILNRVEKEFMPIIIKMYTNMFVRSGLTAHDASAKGHDTYRAVCRDGSG